MAVPPEDPEHGPGGAMVAVLSPCAPCTGNHTTAQRIRGLLLRALDSVDSAVEGGATRASGLAGCVLISPDDAPTGRELQGWLAGNGIGLLIALHAYRSGRLLVEPVGMPTVLVFGGSDINEFAREEEALAVMAQAVRHASALVSFNRIMADRARALWPECGPKLHIIPQSVEAAAAGRDCATAFSALRERVRVRFAELHRPPGEIGAVQCVFLLVAGVRPVKDVLFCAEAFSGWHRRCQRQPWLFIVGPVIDAQYTAQVASTLEHLAGVELLPAMPKAELHAMLPGASAVVNSSKSEGMCSAVLEAMAHGVPVICRDIPGNAAIVTHEETGFLFATPTEFVTQCRRCRDEALAGVPSTVARALAYVQRVHSVRAEATAYRELVDSLLREGAGDATGTQ